MPEEQVWNTFFNPQETLHELGINKDIKVLIDIGGGYGTFLIPAASLVKNKVIGIDIEDKMIEICWRKVQEHETNNIELLHGDITTEQTIKALNKYRSEIDYICLFNILHCEQPLDLFHAVYNILKQNGRIGVIHWKYEDTSAMLSRLQEMRPISSAEQRFPCFVNRFGMRLTELYASSAICLN